MKKRKLNANARASEGGKSSENAGTSGGTSSASGSRSMLQNEGGKPTTMWEIDQDGSTP